MLPLVVVAAADEADAVAAAEAEAEVEAAAVLAGPMLEEGWIDTQAVAHRLPRLRCWPFSLRLSYIEISE